LEVISDLSNGRAGPLVVLILAIGFCFSLPCVSFTHSCVQFTLFVEIRSFKAATRPPNSNFGWTFGEAGWECLESYAP